MSFDIKCMKRSILSNKNYDSWRFNETMSRRNYHTLDAFSFILVIRFLFIPKSKIIITIAFYYDLIIDVQQNQKCKWSKYGENSFDLIYGIFNDVKRISAISSLYFIRSSQSYDLDEHSHKMKGRYSQKCVFYVQTLIS